MKLNQWKQRLALALAAALVAVAGAGLGLARAASSVPAPNDNADGGGEECQNGGGTGRVSQFYLDFLHGAQGGCRSCGGTGGPAPGIPHRTAGMPQWGVSEPYVNLRLTDTPLGYQPAQGPAVAFTLDYKQRGATGGQSVNEFGVGRQWTCAWLSYVEPGATNWVLLPGGRKLDFTATYEYFTGASLEDLGSNGWQLVFPDGRTNRYAMAATVDGVTRYYLTEQVDVRGQRLTFQYADQGNTPSVARLLRVIDGEGQTNTLSYRTSGWSTNLIDHVTDRFGHTNWLQYDASGRLTHITDVVGLTNALAYDANHWITTLTTPYGTTTFAFTEVEDVEDQGWLRAVAVTDAGGGRHLWVYRAEITALPMDGLPDLDIDGFSTTVYDRNYSLANTFYWGPRQCPLLTHTNDLGNLTLTEYGLARRQHWLSVDANAAVSLAQDFSPDGTTLGQPTWFDYAQSSGNPTQRQPLMTVRLLPNGETWFQRYECNQWGYLTNAIATYALADGTRGYRTNTADYSSDGLDLLAQYGPDGEREAGYAYTNHLVRFVTNALEEVTAYAYNASNQLISVLRPGGALTTNQYYASGAYAGWLEWTMDYAGATPVRTNRYTYTNGLVWTRTDERGLTTTNTWDALGRLTLVRYPDGTGVTNTYEKLDLVRTVDRLGATNRFGYDSMRRQTTVTNALGRVTLYSYCDCGVLDSVTEALGTAQERTTTYAYDAAGRRTNSVSSADGFSVQTVYNALGQVVFTLDSAGTCVTNWYNHQGLRYAASNSLGRLSFVQYDLHDHVTEQTDANGVTVTNTYDAAGRLLTRTYPDGGVEQYGYTTNVASVTAYTNQLNQVTRYGYDASGRKTAETNANTEVVQYAYTPAGDLATLRDGKNQQTTWQYDAYGRVTNKVDNVSATAFRYTYDAGGRLATRWTPVKGTTAYAYDAVGNLTNVDYPSSADLRLEYDALNRLTTLADAVGTNRYTYTAWSALASEDGPWAGDTVTNRYTLRRRTSLGVPVPGAADWAFTYGWDTLGRLTGVTNSAGGFGYCYAVDQAGSLAAISLPGGGFITNTFDPLARLLSTTAKDSAGAVLNAHSYGYNAGNQRTQQVFTAGNFVNYTYDAIGQLQSARGKESGGVTNRLQEQFGYAYDAAGNLNTRTNNALRQTFNVNSLNELTTITRSGTLTVAGTTTGVATNVTVNTSNAVRYADWAFASDGFSLVDGMNTFTAIAKASTGQNNTNAIQVNLPATLTLGYDANGNLTTNGTRRLDYDDENQLISVTEPGQWKSAFAYDGKLRRRVRTEAVWQGGAWVTNDVVLYVYDGMLVVQERHYNPQLSTLTPQQTVSYTRGRDLSGSLEGAGGIGGLLARTDHSLLTSSSSLLATALFHSDGNGNVTALVSTNGLLLGRYTYDPYGNLLALVGASAEANGYRFSSKEHHGTSGLYYYGYRFYAPEVQRWVNRDPIGEPGGQNLFSFVKNVPPTGFDAFGLSECTDACKRSRDLCKWGVRLVGVGCVAVTGALCAAGCATAGPIIGPICARICITLEIAACIAIEVYLEGKCDDRYDECMAACNKCPAAKNY